MLMEIVVPDNSVVPKREPLTEEEFHNAMMVALTRLYQKHGKARVAEWLGVSVRQLANIAAGSLPAPHRLQNLVIHDPDALDPIDREYGIRRVPRDAVCSSDPVSTKLAMLLTRTIDIEHPASDGGTDATLAELLDLPDDVLRAVAHKFNGWVARIDAHRHGKPKVAA